MQTNAVSYRTKQQNLLKAKTQSFQDNYSASFTRARSTSSMHNLAGTLYSAKQNREMSPQRRASRSGVFPLIKFENPEMTHSAALKGLNMRASHIANYSDINTELLLQRKDLEQKIAFLREQIAKEKKLFSRTQISCKKANNDIQRAFNSTRDLENKSDRLNAGINETRQDCYELKNTLVSLNGENSNTEKAIAGERATCQALQGRCKMLKNGVLVEEKARGQLKADLTREQKVMTGCSILTKELEHERAVLLLEINHSVALNRLS